MNPLGLFSRGRRIKGVHNPIVINESDEEILARYKSKPRCKKRNKKVKKIPIIITLLVLTISLLTICSYAYWDELIQVKENQYNIGDGVTLSVNEIALGSEGSLVPESAIVKNGNVTELIYQYNLNLDYLVQEDLLLHVEIKNKQLYSGNQLIVPGDEVTLEEIEATINVFNFVVFKDEFVNKTDSGTNVVLIITINDDLLTQNIAKIIKNKTLHFTVEFSADKG